MITLKNVSFRYNKNSLPILKHIDLNFQDGNTYIVLGKNGSGKTTLLKLLLGFIKPTDGNLEYDRKYIIGYLPDFNGLYENMTVLENIKFRLGIYSLNYSKLESKILDWLTSYDLFDAKDSFVCALSLGMKKKVAIICTCIVMPDLLIMDEPTGGIDQQSKTELIKMLNNLRRSDCITICTSHDNDFVKELNGHVIKLGDN